jgi:4-amino-4-deoxy-L-arabinose transferase-like glycosyltransferase
MRADGKTRFVPLLLALAAAVCLLNLSGRDLWEPNEPIAAQAAREMARRGDWLLPTVNGEIYPDKPPLLFWGIGLASLPGGKVTETTARIPSALAALALVLAVYLLSRRALGETGALLSAASLAVSSFFLEQARYVQHDMLLILGVTVGTLAMFRIADSEGPTIGWIVLASLSLGFGVLAKGPVALALPAFMIVADTVLERRLLRRWGWLILAGLLALLPPLLYYVALVHRHGAGLLEDFLFRHNVDRFVEGFDHLLPWWFFLARTPVDFLPVSLFLPAALLFRTEDPERRRFLRRCWIWLLVPLVFFSFSASKRPIYMLPALPAVAMLCGAVLDAAIRGELRPAGRKLAVFAEGSALALLGLAGAGAPLLAMRRAPELLPAASLLAACALAGSMAGLLRLARGRLFAAHATLVAALALVWIVVIYRVHPAANAGNSPRAFAETVARVVPPDAPLRTYGMYRFRSGYLFYADRPMPRLEDVSAVTKFLDGEGRVFCIVRKEDLQGVRNSLSRPIYVLAQGRAGHREEVLISNRPEGAVPRAPAGSPDTAPASPAPDARSGSGS